MAQTARTARPSSTATATTGPTAGSLDPSLPTIAYQRHPDAATAPLPHGYHRREPEKSVLHAIVREHLETFLAQAPRLHGEGYPRFIERQFRPYVDCCSRSQGARTDHSAVPWLDRGLS